MKPSPGHRPQSVPFQETHEREPLRFRLLRVAGLAGIVALLVLSLLPGDIQAPIRTGIPGVLEHFMAYATVAFCLRGGFTGKGSSVWIVTSLAVLAGLLELLQGLVPGRSPAIADAVAGFAGAWLGCKLGVIFRQRW
jgi:VanZ family protein